MMLVTEINSIVKNLEYSPKIIVQLADPFISHTMWFSSKKFDLYLSPTKKTTLFATKHGVPRNKIDTVGWVVRNTFYKNQNPSISQKALGLNPKKMIIFLGGGGKGGGKIFATCQHLSSSKIITSKCQIIAVAGKNKTLYQKLVRFAPKYPEIVLPYFDPKNIAQLLNASDFAIGKAGPNFLFECITMGKPLLATGCPPGQEDANLKFIRAEGLGWVRTNPKESIRPFALQTITAPSKDKPSFLEKTVGPFTLSITHYPDRNTNEIAVYDTRNNRYLGEGPVSLGSGDKNELPEIFDRYASMLERGTNGEGLAKTIEAERERESSELREATQELRSGRS